MHIIYILSQEAETGPEPCVSGSLIVDLAGEVEKLLIKEVATLMAQAELLCIREGFINTLQRCYFFLLLSLCVFFSSNNIGFGCGNFLRLYMIHIKKSKGLDLFFFATKVPSVRIDFFL